MDIFIATILQKEIIMNDFSNGRHGRGGRWHRSPSHRFVDCPESQKPLCEFSVGSHCRVASLCGFMMKKRLANMGLGVGSVLEILKNDRTGGPMIVFVDSVRIALGRGMAIHVCCEEVDGD